MGILLFVILEGTDSRAQEMHCKLALRQFPLNPLLWLVTSFNHLLITFGENLELSR